MKAWEGEAELRRSIESRWTEADRERLALGLRLADNVMRLAQEHAAATPDRQPALREQLREKAVELNTIALFIRPHPEAERLLSVSSPWLMPTSPRP